jgi:hypothetical protein
MDGPQEGPFPHASGDPEADYFQAIEEYFVARRGDPLLLSNADWFLIRKWRQADIPLRVVLRGIRDALDAHAHSFGRRRKVGSLRYCEAEVQAARERWYRALSLGREAGTDLGALLEGLALSLETAELPGEAASLRDRIVAELRARSVEPGDAAQLDVRLREHERTLCGRLREVGGPEGLAWLEAQVDADLAPYGGRMPAHVLAQVRDESLTRRLLERYALPRLSLFNAG